MKEAPRPDGWYLGLRYMQGEGLVACKPEPVEGDHHGARFLFAEDVLLLARDWRALVVNWWTALAPGGHLILWVPDCRFQFVAEGLARVTCEQLAAALDDVAGWTLLEAELIAGHAFVVWRKEGDARQERAIWKKGNQHVLVARTGALGDVLMAASVFPGLKAQGWTVSFLGKSSGVELVRHDPHVDELITLGEGQVADEEMPFFWQAWARRFDRFVNLTHSIEGELLKQPGRADYWWSDAQRRALCGRSYLAQVHALAEVPQPYAVRFYPDQVERVWAEAEAARLGSFVLWCLRGSAAHKWWPWAPQAVCQLLAQRDVTIVLTGDEHAQALADEIRAAVRNYHGEMSRVVERVGTLTIREVMSLAQKARVVVGPETGVMHAVALTDVPKVLLLSHSSRRNLSDDWTATIALEPRVGCYPCHRLHYGHDWCPQDAVTEAAACAASLSVAEVVAAVKPFC